MVLVRPPAADAFVHLNHASTSLPDPAVFEAMRGLVDGEAALGMHRVSGRDAVALDAARDAAGRLLGVGPHRAAFVESSSRGWALALTAVAPDRPLDVFVGPAEWSANLLNLAREPRATRIVCEQPADGRWAATIERALAGRDPSRVPVVSLATTSCYGETVEDLAAVGAVVRAHGGWLFVDAAQSIGRIPFDMDALAVDVVVAPARKWLRGPRGVALLGLSERALSAFDAPRPTDLTALASVDAMEPSARRFEIHEHQPALRLGFAAAVAVFEAAGPDRIATAVRERGERLRSALAAAGIAARPSRDATLACIARPVADAARVARRLWDDGVNVGVVGADYAPLAFDRTEALIRLSPHAFTTDDEIDRGVARLARALAVPT